MNKKFYCFSRYKKKYAKKEKEADSMKSLVGYIIRYQFKGEMLLVNKHSTQSSP